MKDSTDVLIAGAGPVGLLLAAELRRDGIAVHLVDQMAERTFFCKALGVTARTLEIFDTLGLADAAIDAGVWVTGVESWQDGAPADAMSLQESGLHESGLPYGALSLAQFETERLLEGALGQHGGHVEYGTVLEGFSEQSDHVLARLRGADGALREMRCRWLVGCDGARSTVRTQLDLPYEGGRYAQTFALADLDVDWRLPRGPMYRFSWSGSARAVSSLAAVPVRGSVRRYRLSVIVEAEELAAQLLAAGAPDFEQLNAMMLPVLPPDTQLSSLRWSSVYRVSHRIAPSYGRGRVLIAGDAAHIHPPVGGQGMNTGLQDAHNLAWKLSLAARGLAQPALVDSYSAERRPVGLDVVEATTRAMNAVLAQRAALPGMRETQLLVGYRDSPLVADACPQFDAALPAPGDRVPDVDGLTQPFVGHATRLQQRVGRGRHTLLGYVDATGGDATGGDATGGDSIGVDAVRVDAIGGKAASGNMARADALHGDAAPHDATDDDAMSSDALNGNPDSGIAANATTPAAQLEACIDGFRTLAAVLGSAADALIIASPDSGLPRDERIPVFTDSAREFAAAFRAPGGTVWVIRPDGHIGWRSKGCTEAALRNWMRQAALIE
ncbi:hypothetical protein GCM10027093_24360 [Paraburkholderia jirisanensis]